MSGLNRTPSLRAKVSRAEYKRMIELSVSQHQIPSHYQLPMSSFQRQSISPELEFVRSPTPPTDEQRLEELAALAHSWKAKLEKLDNEYATVKSEYVATNGKGKKEEYSRLRKERHEASKEWNECEEAKEVSEVVD